MSEPLAESVAFCWGEPVKRPRFSRASICGRNVGPWVYTVGVLDVKMEIPAKQ